ncbi:MAG: FecR domain-containing protein [Candidatus Omnitrophica bacterium]|nr:FecR domain-containing protein [Candidatus Omnitrophota bacterium]
MLLKRIISSVCAACLFSLASFCQAEDYDPSIMYRSGSEYKTLDTSQEDDDSDTDDSDYNKIHAEVVSVSGSPKVMLSGENSYVDAEVGMYLEAGDKIKTNSSSSISLSFDDNDKNIASVDSDSYAEVILDTGEKLSLLEGKIFAAVDQASEDEPFEIKTPTAVVGVRGTEFLTTVDEQGTDVESITGIPYVKNMERDGSFSKKAVNISAGYKVRVKKFMSPGEPVKIPIQRQNKWKEFGKNVRDKAKENRPIRKKIPGNKIRKEIKQKLHKPLDKNIQQPVNLKDQKVPIKNKIEQKEPLKKIPNKADNKDPVTPKIIKKPVVKQPTGMMPPINPR